MAAGASAGQSAGVVELNIAGLAALAGARLFRFRDRVIRPIG